MQVILTEPCQNIKKKLQIWSWKAITSPPAAANGCGTALLFHPPAHQNGQHGVQRPCLKPRLESRAPMEWNHGALAHALCINKGIAWHRERWQNNLWSGDTPGNTLLFCTSIASQFQPALRRRNPVYHKQMKGKYSVLERIGNYILLPVCFRSNRSCLECRLLNLW